MQQPTPQPNVPPLAKGSIFSWTFWILVVLTGIGTGIGAGLLMMLLRAVQHAAWDYHSGIFLIGVLKTSSLHRVLTLLLAGIFVGFSLWVVRRIAEKHGAELTAAIWFQSGKLPLLRTTLRAIISITGVGLGVALGREEAPKQAGAVIAAILCRWKRLSPLEQRLLIAGGAGAGMAAVYNVPLGGALFALEVLLGTLSLSYFLPVLAISCIATMTSWLFLPIQPTYFIPEYPLSKEIVVWAIVMGPILGVGSVLYTRLIALAHRCVPRHRGRVITPIVAMPLVGIMAIWYPQILGNGKDLVQQAFVGQDSLLLLAALLFMKPIATAISLGSGTPGGLFTPTLTCGALLGGVLGDLWARLWPGQPPGVYAIIGAGAVLAATTQGPLSAIVLLLELTRHLEVLTIPLLLAVAEATLTVRLLDSRSIYSGRIGESGSADTGENKGKESISGGANYAVVLEHLLHRADPSQFLEAQPLEVVDEAGESLGQILPSSLAGEKAPFISPNEDATASDLIAKMP